MEDKNSLEVLDHAAGVADDLIARALAIVMEVQDGDKNPQMLASAVGHLVAASALLKARRIPSAQGKHLKKVKSLKAIAK